MCKYFENYTLLTSTVDLYCHSWEERERETDVPLDSLVSGNGKMMILAFDRCPKGNFSLFDLQFAREQMLLLLPLFISFIERKITGSFQLEKGRVLLNSPFSPVSLLLPMIGFFDD